MTEDLDKDLQDLLGNLGSEGGETGESPGGLDLNAALNDMGSESAGGEESGGLDMDSALSALGGEGPGTEAGSGGSVGSDLEDALKAMDAKEPAPKKEKKAAKPRGGGAKSAPAPAPVTVDTSLAGLDHTRNLDYLLDIKLNVTFEVGRAKMQVSDLLTLGQGSVIELHRLVGDELDLLINGRLVAKGAVVVVNEKFGCKVTEIISPEQRIKHMGTV